MGHRNGASAGLQMDGRLLLAPTVNCEKWMLTKVLLLLSQMQSLVAVSPGIATAPYSILPISPLLRFTRFLQTEELRLRLLNSIPDIRKRAIAGPSSFL